MNSVKRFTLTLAAVCACAVAAAAYQGGVRPPDPPAAPARPKPPSPRRSPKVRERVKPGGGVSAVKSDPLPRRPQAQLAELVVTTDPPDSVVLINGVEHFPQGSVVRSSQLSPGSYSVIVRRPEYTDQEYTVGLVAGTSTPLMVKLKPAYGTINVTPNVGGSEIIVHDADNNRHVGRYDDRVQNLRVPPGRYEVAVSKQGYRTATRQVVVTASQIIYIEPPLEQLPPERPRVRPDAITTIKAATDGKYLFVEIYGKSGDASASTGSLDVTVSMKNDSRMISGMLPGYPCRVDFVRLENVAEYAFAEAPGAGNQWGRVAVRVRPKDSKRPMHFLINWVVLDNAAQRRQPGSPTDFKTPRDRPPRDAGRRT